MTTPTGYRLEKEQNGKKQVEEIIETKDGVWFDLCGSGAQVDLATARLMVE